MKKVYSYLTCFLIIISCFSVQASHLKGGEIYWECFDNGKFVFHLNVFSECSSLFSYGQTAARTINISSTNPPRNVNGNVFTTIGVNADWNLYQQTNNGDYSPTCLDSVSLGFSCANNDLGIIKFYPFKSDTIVLKGTPPASGWLFYYSESSRTANQNISPGSFGLRSIMYRIPNPAAGPNAYYSTDVCKDNAPRFAAKPEVRFCRKNEFSFTHFAQDDDLDSISYFFDFPSSAVGSNVPYQVGYAYNRPFPGKTQDSLNINTQLDRQSGIFKQTVFSGSGLSEYTTVMRVDSWRCGSKISSVFREVAFFLEDCELLDSATARINKNPKCFFNGQESNVYNIEITAGEIVEFDFMAMDPDIINGKRQTITVEPKGDLFASNFQFVQNCKYEGECATLNSSPSIYNAGNFSEYVFRDTIVQTKFRWQSSCIGLTSLTGQNCGAVDQTAYYSILFKVYDDVCPTRAATYATAIIKVRPKPILSNPIVKGASVGFDGKINLNWVPPIDSANSFVKYEIEGLAVNDGSNPSAFLTVQNNINSYYSSNSFPFLNFVPNLWSPFPAGKDYYFRMKTQSGCFQDKTSSNSQQVRLIETNATSTGPVSNPNSKINLSWNAPKPSGAATKDYFVYESPTWYHVWQNNDANSDLTNTSNWYLRDGATQNRSMELTANTCSPLVALRVEARDTVITYKQGSGILDMQYDTLTFSTYGIIAVNPMQLGQPSVKDQTLDYLYSDIDGATNYQWINCNTNSPIPNSNSAQYIPLDTGSFRVIVGTANCIDTSICFSNGVLLDPTVTVVSNNTLRSNSGNQKFQWIDCRADTLIPGANSRAFSPLDTGYYAVIVSAYGYKDTSNCIAMLSIGINENAFKEYFSIFPNPSTGRVFIQSNNIIIDQIRIFNQSGQVIMDLQDQNKNQLELEIEEAKGLYFIEITSSKGAKSRQKIIFL